MAASAVALEAIAVPDDLEDGYDRMTAGIHYLDELPSHHHTPLTAAERSIRLLEMHIRSGYERIRCTLTQHGLDDIPQYVALSYTWDQGRGRKHVECDGMDLEIGENLWHFLCEFRKKQVLRQLSADASAHVHYLWIDAICIDQSSLTERNQQVALMRDVYTKAESVIVWLGLARGCEELAFILTRHPDLIEVAKVQTELLGLLNKPYFGRVWVVQEFVLAQSVTIWCGELAAEATEFDKIWNEDKDFPGFQRLSGAIIETAAWPLFKHRRDFRQSHRRNAERTSFRLRELLRSFDSSQSSEVYDKVYGFLGIASDEQLVARPIRPDYSKAPVELLVDVLRIQYSDPSVAINLDDYEFVTNLLQILCITRMDFAKYLLRETPDLEEQIYMFVVSDFLAVTISLATSITYIGSFEHISGPSDNDIRTAVLSSSRRLPQLTANDIAKLISPVTLRDITHGLDFEGLSRTHPLFRKEILASMHSIMRSLFQKNSDRTSLLSKHVSENSDLRRKFACSFQKASTTPSPKTHYTPNWYRKYAAFKGTNDQIGVLCTDDNYDEASKASIYLFTGSDNSRKALLIQQRNPTRLVIVGFAIITSSTLKPYLSNIVQPLQSVYRKGESARKASYPPPAVTGVETATCFHCHVIGLLDLGRCGILDELQLTHILERSLRGGADDEVHKCAMGTGQCPSLEFEANSNHDR